MPTKQIFIGAIVAVILMVGYAALFTVNERELAIKFRLGEIVRSDYEPGLYVQIPFINNVSKFDKRILTLDARPTEYLTKEKKKLVVDFFAKWRIKNVETFYKSMSRGSMLVATQRIYNIINDGLKSQFSSHGMSELVSGVRTSKGKKAAVKVDPEQKDLRSTVMSNITQQANAAVEKYGITVVDIRIKRIDLTDEISSNVFRRMTSERQQLSADIRARGKESSEKLKAGADRQRTVTLAEAYKESQRLRGEGDAKASVIYAKAYNRDPEFYSFYRSLNAYKNSFKNKDDILVLEPSSDFFEYFKTAKPKR